MVGERVFPYIGSKYNIAQWLASKLPPHTTYVEPFGGSGALLYTKPKSGTEVYNDADEDLVEFFRILPGTAEEIEKALRDVEFTREQHERWTRHWYEGWRPSIEPDHPNSPGPEARWAAAFFFTRYSQYKNKYRDYAGFYQPQSNPDNAAEFEEKRHQLTQAAERFQNVQIENRDYKEILEDFDGPNTLFYLDPPYVGKEEYYGEFTHECLVEVVNELEGKFILSYGQNLPDGLDHHRRIRMTGVPGDRADTEHHVMNFGKDLEGGFRNALVGDW